MTSGLNRIPTSVMNIIDCVSHAFNPNLSSGERPVIGSKRKDIFSTTKVPQTGKLSSRGRGLPSQNEWSVKGTALVTDVPITYLGYVNRDSGVIEEPGHPLDGQSIGDTILIYPKGSGSTVAPFVLMGLIYTGKGPKAIINNDVCPLTLPACSLLNLPYAYGMSKDLCIEVNTGDEIEMKLIDGVVQFVILKRF